MKVIAAHALCGLAALCVAAVSTTSAYAQAGAPLEQRKIVYAPWNPADMPQRRKEQGLIGPGPQAGVTAPAFPSYLKKPSSVEELMPQARAAVRQSGGRTPLGLVLPGKTLLIVVGEIREPRPNMMVQEALKRAIEERGAKAVVVTTWDLLGVTEEQYVKVRTALR